MDRILFTTNIGQLKNNNGMIKKASTPLNGSILSKERFALNDNAIRLIKTYYLNYLKKKNSHTKKLSKENS